MTSVRDHITIFFSFVPSAVTRGSESNFTVLLFVFLTPLSLNAPCLEGVNESLFFTPPVIS